MKFFALSFLLNLKKFLTRQTFWWGLVALPVILAFGGMFLRTESPAVTITAGIYFNPDSAFEAAIFDALYETAFTRFTAYDDSRALIEDVRLGRIECGYIINPNIESAKYGDFSGLVTLVTSPRTMVAPIFNDMVTAAVLRASAEYITKEGLRGFFGESDADELNHFVNWQFEAYRQMDIFMVPLFVDTSGQAEEARADLAEITARRVFRGMIGLTIHILIIFAAPIFIEERRSGLTKALSIHGKLAAYDISLWLAAFLAMLVVGASGLASAALFAPYVLPEMPLEIAALTAFAAVCATLPVLAARLLKTSKIIQTLGLFIVIANIAFGGVILDLAEINPNLDYIQRIFPLFWYTSI
jgi:hypothetical protein